MCTLASVQQRGKRSTSTQRAKAPYPPHLYNVLTPRFFHLFLIHFHWHSFICWSIHFYCVWFFNRIVVVALLTIFLPLVERFLVSLCLARYTILRVQYHCPFAAQCSMFRISVTIEMYGRYVYFRLTAVCFGAHRRLFQPSLCLSE